MMRIVVVVLFGQLSMAMLIPEDTEILEGFEPALNPEILPEDDYFEARSMSFGPLFNSVRNKRAVKYDTEESDGLISHFRPNTVNSFNGNVKETLNSDTQPNRRLFRTLVEGLSKKFPDEESDDDEIENYSSQPILQFPNRHRRSTGNDKKSAKGNENEKSEHRAESLPNPMKFTKSSNGFSSRDNPSAASLVGKFTRSPFEYSKIQHEEDSLMDSSSLSINEGMKSRTPRVNFVTQQKKSADQDDTKAASASKSDFYKTPPLLHNSKETSASASATSSERYPERSSTARPTDSYSMYKDRDVNTNRYDDRYIEDMYPPPPDTSDSMYSFNGAYDPYMRRPYADYSSGYSSSRYDIPDYRDYPPPYGNEIDSRYYMRSDMMSPPPLPPPSSSSSSSSSSLPRKRIVYYAFLPEVVRSPPTVDFRYRSFDRSYDPYYDFYNYEPNMMRNAYRRPLPDRPPLAEKASMIHENRAARPTKLYNDDMSRNNSSTYEKRFEPDRFYNDNRGSMQPYPYRKPYDPYSY